MSLPLLSPRHSWILLVHMDAAAISPTVRGRVRPLTSPGDSSGSANAAIAVDISCRLRRFVDAAAAIVSKLSHGGWSDVDGQLDPLKLLHSVW
jgi:hypothetical protein